MSVLIRTLILWCASWCVHRSHITPSRKPEYITRPFNLLHKFEMYAECVCLVHRNDTNRYTCTRNGRARVVDSFAMLCEIPSYTQNTLATAHRVCHSHTRVRRSISDILLLLCSREAHSMTNVWELRLKFWCPSVEKLSSCLNIILYGSY